jgi:hypothetical protein
MAERGLRAAVTEPGNPRPASPGDRFGDLAP